MATPKQIAEQVALERDQIRQGLKRLRKNTKDLELKKSIFAELKSLYKKCIYLSSELVQNQTYFKSDYEF